MIQGNSGNQRVTNAVLMVELKNMGKDINEIKDGMKEIKDDVKPNTEYRITGKERWKAHDREHASQRTKSWAGDIGAAIVGAGAAVGAFLGKQ